MPSTKSFCPEDAYRGILLSYKMECQGDFIANFSLPLQLYIQLTKLGIAMTRLEWCTRFPGICWQTIMNAINY